MTFASGFSKLLMYFTSYKLIYLDDKSIIMASEKRKGRPPGSKSIGIPFKTIMESADLVKMALNEAGDNTMSFKEMSEFMKLPRGAAIPTAGALVEFGLVEKSSLGWKISDLGKIVSKGDPAAYKEALEKNEIFRDLSRRYWNRLVTPGIINGYLKSKYRKGENVFRITERFLEAMEFIKRLQTESGGLGKLSEEEKFQPFTISDWLKIIQLKYALEPPTKSEIENLAEQVANSLDNSSDISFKAISSNIRQYKENKEILAVQVDNIMKIVSAKYPNFAKTTEVKDESETKQ